MSRFLNPTTSAYGDLRSVSPSAMASLRSQGQADHFVGIRAFACAIDRGYTDDELLDFRIRMVYIGDPLLEKIQLGMVVGHGYLLHRHVRHVGP